MKHQIILLGKDITSIYHGIKEFMPDCVHFLFTEQTRFVADTMYPLLPATVKKFNYYTAPYDGNQVIEICRSIHRQFEGEFTYHLSEGTKPMALAAFRVASEHNARAFYLTQLGELVWMDTFETAKMHCQLYNEEILALSGNIYTGYHDIRDLRPEDIWASRQIKSFIENHYHEHARIQKFFSIFCRRQISKLPASKLLANGLRLKINNGKLLITRQGKLLLRLNTPNGVNLFFKGSWWETLVAFQVKIWSESKINPPEVWQNVLFRTDNSFAQAKNEIDVLVNNRQDLIFIECKSGQVTQNDIYKIDGVRETYGGDISRAVLASYYPLEHGMMEKCKDVQINVFAPERAEGRLHFLESMPGWLDKLTHELQL